MKNNSSVKEEAVIVRVKLLIPDAKMPSLANEGDVAFDLYSTIDIDLQPGQRIAVPTGISVEIPRGYEGQIRPRSGLALQYGVTVLNAPGTIDSGFRGEVKSIMVNLGSDTFRITKGMRICQLAVRHVADVQLVKSEALTPSERGEKGFGSSGH
ncbi:MAG: dUTP diphosphatase [Candidatus Thorarchaeota archaeon]|nr:MAG: dUTP diphosphatase [Candidatus Thorarchaeota archaeon]